MQWLNLKNRVSQLKVVLERAKVDRQEWEERLENAEISLRYHVKETMDQYIEEFVAMANMLGAKAQGKLDQDGQSYQQWKLHLKLAFDGKEMKPYYDPIFSSGQRAAISIMLLLASLSNKKKVQRIVLCFLMSLLLESMMPALMRLVQSSKNQYSIFHYASGVC